MGGYWQDYADPQSHQVFHVWEGHYTYPGTTLTLCQRGRAECLKG